ncbi:DUF3126 family protein [Formicincola oecophyllae]|uniref:DUF3126 family protein n=1 Tax=Formicincola oecophyllae TaxID=2558361 RepID=A0A4Y6UCB2_9PROT|nr:DUF3126 family protein [Formicincola oecophyllae]QDH14208.1 DUF3126 family protein [Formicincola oecophyllae]
MADLSASEIPRLQGALRRLLHSPDITVRPDATRKGSFEVAVGPEAVGTVYRDDEDGEVTYAINITVLQEDLPPA